MSTCRFTPLLVLAAAGSVAAPASATVVVQMYNLAPNPGVKRSVTIGSHTLAQYNLTDFRADTPVPSALAAREFAPIGNSQLAFGTDAIPTSSAGLSSSALKITPSSTDQYVQLAFDIRGHSTVGVATFAPDTTLETIAFNSVVPEPAVWAELIVGFALAGAGLRVSRRQRHPSAMAR